jgi:RNA polymerase sigma-70 factor (ECF subfamily)
VTIPEQVLIGRIQKGDAAAYTELVRRYRLPLFQSVCRILGDADAAADVTQQAFISAYENIQSYDPDHRFFSWLYRMAFNGAMNKLQRRKFQQPLGEGDLLWPGPPTDARVQDREQTGCLQAAMAALEYKYRVVLVLRHYLDFSYAEIARTIDLPTTTVRSRIHTARLLLKQDLIARGLEAWV